MRRLRAVGLLLTVAGIVTIFVSTGLPLVKLPQTFARKGPSIALDERTTYWIDNWVLPPIDAGTPVLVDLEASIPGGLSIVIFPSQGGEVIPGSSALVTHVFDANQQTFSTSVIAMISSEYIISIVSIKNTFTLTINSKWSPFYGLKAYLYLGLGMLPVGLLIIYSDKINESKERILREALKTDSG